MRWERFVLRFYAHALRNLPSNFNRRKLLRMLLESPHVRTLWNTKSTPEEININYDRVGRI